jgi:tyrosyl-DNA phosphodiesterase-1
MIPIEIDDSSDDDEVEIIDVKPAPAATRVPTEAASAAKVQTSSLPSLKRRRPDGQDSNNIKPAPMASKTGHCSTNSIAAARKEKEPAALQFKLFATEQDRQALRFNGSSSSSLLSSSSSSSSSSSMLNDHCQTLSQMLGINEHGGEMEWIVISNFLLESDFLLDEVPELISCPKIVIFYEHGNPQPWPNTEFIRITPRDEPSSPSNPTANPLRYKHRFGCHHSKMFLIGFRDRLRVIIHTANLTYVDIYKKAQGAYIQDFPLKSKGGSASSATRITNDFEENLISYMESYGYNKTYNWSSCHGESAGNGLEKITLQRQLSRYDFSGANVVLIPSVPGYYSLPEKCKAQGYLKLKGAIDAHTNTYASEISHSANAGQLICQFSSIGSLSEKWLKEFVSSISIPQERNDTGTGKMDRQQLNLADSVKLVYPTAEEIRLSIEGYGGGKSVPGRTNNVQKSFLKPLYCKWASSETGSGTRNPIHKANNVPHIKSYYQLTPDGSAMEWFMLGSHNLSKAAWGEVINGKYGKCLRVLSWELGVFVSPKLTGGRLVPYTGNGNTHRTQGQDSSRDTVVPLPYRMHPERYNSTDEPWTVDTAYNRADRFGHNSAMG